MVVKLVLTVSAVSGRLASTPLQNVEGEVTRINDLMSQLCLLTC